MPFGEEESKVRRCALLYTSSAYNFSSGVVTSGASTYITIARSSSGVNSG